MEPLADFVTREEDIGQSDSNLSTLASGPVSAAAAAYPAGKEIIDENPSYLVTFDGRNDLDPRQWNESYRWGLTSKFSGRRYH
jgi:hypothetical protein